MWTVKSSTEASGRGGDAQSETEQPLHPALAAAINRTYSELSALDVKVSSYVHFICKSSREEDLRHRF